MNFRSGRYTNRSLMNIVKHSDDRDSRPGPTAVHRKLLSNRILAGKVAGGKSLVHHYNRLRLRRISFAEEAPAVHRNAHRLGILRAGKPKVTLRNLIRARSFLTDDPKGSSQWKSLL